MFLCRLQEKVRWLQREGEREYLSKEDGFANLYRFQRHKREVGAGGDNQDIAC
jgi:hypothetical protein